MTNLKREHIAWVDLLRVVACFLVVVAHACDPFVAQIGVKDSEFLWGAYIGSLVRPCVPLFVMISGVLLLPTNMNMKDFYARRAKRLFVPFIFWSLVLPVLNYLYFSTGIESTNPAINPDNYTVAATINKMYTFIFNFNQDTTPMWYVYMLIGIYLFLPIMSAWLVQASKKDIQYFLGIWIVSLCLPYIALVAPYLGYTGDGLLGACTWNSFGMLYYFSGFLGYVILAYYLKKYPLNWNASKRFGIGIPMFVVGYLAAAFGFIYASRNFPGQWNIIEIPWYFYGISVFLMTFPVYLIMQNIKIKQSALLSKIASLTFGIFLCHFVFVQIGYDFVYTFIPVPAPIQIILTSIVAFLLSMLIIWLMSLSKITRKVIM
ncbi:acyltransferase [Bacteroides sp. 51]|uniref:acyltransferase n=1 Tax=Bacteroides sp. 51 TaxID=2302938 RepID=UPI0013D328DB|nr:acyltransferase [Bacteroides sp. 51]NDV82718.1 acyltransferase [Bacteroides sp. 51]